MVTSADVARAAGTSRAVVSYVVNGGPRNVAEPTRQRVLAAMDQLGYRPDPHARALRTATSSVVGVVVSNISNAYCAEMVLALEDAAIDRGYSLLIGNAMRDERREASHVATFHSQRVPGIVFLGSNEPLAARARIFPDAAGSGRPAMIRFDRPALEDGETAILVDNAAGAADVVRHLLAHGYDECALLAGPAELHGVPDRAAGWARALQEHGLDPGAQSVISSGFDRYAAAAAALPLLRDRRPRALFASTDEQAIGVLWAAARLGMQVPMDVAVASFDGIREGRLTTPSLTTAKQPFAAAARLAIAHLGDRNAGTAPRRDIVLPLELQVGASCGTHPADDSPAR